MLREVSSETRKERQRGREGREEGEEGGGRVVGGREVKLGVYCWHLLVVQDLVSVLSLRHVCYTTAASRQGRLCVLLLYYFVNETGTAAAAAAAAQWYVCIPFA